MPITLRQLQSEQREWVDHNFPKRADYYHLLGVMEELGELAHARLKGLEKIRDNGNLEMKEMDAIGDLVIFLMGYCNDRNFDLQDIVESTWENVKLRDWRKFPKNGVTE